MNGTARSNARKGSGDAGAAEGRLRDFWKTQRSQNDMSLGARRLIVITDTDAGFRLLEILERAATELNAAETRVAG